MDLGASFRPLNLPLFSLLSNRLFSLRRVIPLQLGFAWQNVIPPKIGIGIKDHYPQVFRWGASYRLAFETWQINVLLDNEFVQKKKTGWFTGLEAFTPMPVEGLQPALRAGWNTRSKAPSFGAGVRFDYFKDAAVRLDFAYGLKSDYTIGSDFRLFLTVDFGKKYDQSYHNELADKDASQAMQQYLHVLVRYQDNMDLAREAAVKLAEDYDANNQERYINFVGGKNAAVWCATTLG